MTSSCSTTYSEGVKASPNVLGLFYCEVIQLSPRRSVINKHAEQCDE